VIDELSRELGAVGIRGRRRERILAEISDHLACDPHADVGEPRVLAQEFADDIATASARRTALVTFLSLAAVALAVGVAQATLPTVPDITGGRSIWLVGAATLAMIIGAQIAFAAGCLAGLRGLRLAGPQEVPLVRRRVVVALVAGAATAAGSALYAVNFRGVVPEWWAVVAIAAAAAAAVPLLVSFFAYAGSGGIQVSRTSPPRGLSADLGPFARPWLIGAAAVLAMFLGTSVVESSVVEGAIRAAFEATAFGLCFLLFRRPLALTG
jgi:hypothetical protein